MIGELVYSVEVGIVHCPGDDEAGVNAGPVETAAKVRYCDICRRWGSVGSTHMCGRNWHRRLSDLLIALARDGRR
jgi:hypothetical protein